jgi:chromosome segregation ATPase
VTGTSRPQLAEAAAQELDALRAALDQKLAALEAALANPSKCASLEALVIDLARVATAEAEAAAARGCLDAQQDAQRQAAAKAEAQLALKTERETLAALQRDLEQARTALKSERDAAAVLRHDRDEAVRALQGEREAAARARRRAEEAQASHDAVQMTSAVLRRDVEDARTALHAAQQAGIELSGSAEQAHAALERERAAAEELRQALGTVKQQLAAANQAAEKRSADVDAAQSLVAGLEQQRRDLERTCTEGTARVDALTRDLNLARTNHERAFGEWQARLEAAARERGALVADLTAARDALDAARRKADERSQTIGQDRAAAERALTETRTELERALRDRDAIAAELETLRQSLQATRAEAGARLGSADQERAGIEIALKDAETSTAAAIRDRDMMAEELEMMRENLASVQNARIQVEQMREAAAARIADLEGELRERDRRQADRRREPPAPALGALRHVRGIEEPDPVEPAPDAQSAGQPPAEAPPDSPVRRASRHAFGQDMQVLIDGSPASLVDLSISGAQVISQTALKPNRMVRVQLTGDAPITCKGKVVWARLEASSTAGLRYRAGVLFTGVDERAVEAFLARHETRT